MARIGNLLEFEPTSTYDGWMDVSVYMPQHKRQNVSFI